MELIRGVDVDNISPFGAVWCDDAAWAGVDGVVEIGVEESCCNC